MVAIWGWVELVPPPVLRYQSSLCHNVLYLVSFKVGDGGGDRKGNRIKRGKVHHWTHASRTHMRFADWLLTKALQTRLFLQDLKNLLFVVKNPGFYFYLYIFLIDVWWVDILNWTASFFFFFLTWRKLFIRFFFHPLPNKSVFQQAFLLYVL